MDVDGARRYEAVEAVQFGQEHLAAEDPAGLRGERGEDAELARCAVDAGALDGDQVAVRVHGEGADAQDRIGRGGAFGGGARGTAQQGTDPGDEFARAVGLGEVVVGAQVEAEQQVVLGGTRGEHQDGQLVSLGAQGTHDVEAVQARHHHVEHEQVGCGPVEVVERLAPVAHDDHGVTLALQVAAGQLGLLLVVLGDHHVRVHEARA